MLSIYPIVEGHGEVAAVPILLRRFAYDVFKSYDFNVLQPHRLPRGRMFAERHLEKAVTLGRLKLDQYDGDQAILIMIDADEDCPAEKAPILLERSIAVSNQIPISIVFAKKEYESWFLAAVHSLRSHGRVADHATAPADPEAIGDAKGHLQRHCMVPGAAYSPTVDQPALTSRFSFEETRQACPSFDKLWRDLERLFQQKA